MADQVVPTLISPMKTTKAINNYKTVKTVGKLWTTAKQQQKTYRAPKLRMVTQKSVGSILLISLHPPVQSSSAPRRIPSGISPHRVKRTRGFQQSLFSPGTSAAFTTEDPRTLNQWRTQLMELSRILSQGLLPRAGAIAMVTLAHWSPSYCCAQFCRTGMPQGLTIYRDQSYLCVVPHPPQS